MSRSNLSAPIVMRNLAAKPIQRVGHRLTRCLGLLIALSAALQLSIAYPQTFLDSIVVVVDDEVITQSELDVHLRNLVRELRSTNKPIPSREVLNRQGAESLIREKLLLREAKRFGVVARSAEVDAALRQVADRNKITEQQLTRAIEAEGMSIHQYREIIGRQLVMQSIIEQEMARRVKVSDAEIDLYLTAERNRGGADEEVELQRILVSLPDNESSDDLEDAKSRTQQVIAQLSEGVSFTTLAQTFSDGPEALKGGDLGWRKLSQLPALYVEVIQNLDTGQHSSVLRGPNGFHIVKVVNRREDAATRIRQVKVRQILLRPNDVLSDQEALNRIGQLRERVLAGESFSDLARAHSVDPISRALGGDLGWISAAQLPPAVRREVGTMQINDVSSPIRTEQGYHLVRLEGDEEREITADLRRLQAREAIAARKRDEAYERYTQELRDEAYIEFRIPI